MNIRFNLRDSSLKESAVRLVLTHKGKVYRKALGISVQSKYWSTKKQKCGDINKDEYLKKIRIQLEERLDDFSSENDILRALSEVVDGVKLDETRRVIPTFWEYFERWANRDAPNPRQRKTPFNKVKKLMGTNDNWEDIDSAYYAVLVERMQDEGMSVNYQGTVISKLKAVMSEGLAKKYHTNTEYQSFKRLQEESDSVALTQEEVDRLWSMEFKNEIDSKARDLFIVGIYTASRLSDYSCFTMANISDGTLRYTSKKTHERVVMPVSPRVITVLKRHGGKVPQLVEQTYRHALKRICKQAKIDTPVQVTRSHGMVHTTETYEKWELVSSHTARRTGATLLYMNHVPLRQCMYITGHRSESTFLKYIKITKEENADMLKDIDFFKSK